MEEENESFLTGYPQPISYDCNKKIIEQMEKNIFKIKIGNEQGTGFFCNIPFPNKENMLPVLITNNHIIKENILYKNNEEIHLNIKGEKDIKTINLNNRLKYTNKDQDITIIEIKKEDNINNYLKLDDQIINDILNESNENKDYIDKTVYIIQYPEGELSVSFGIIEKIFEDKKYDFKHKCNTKLGSSGSPILNIINNKLIGIHKKGSKVFKRGTFLNYCIKDFIAKNYYIEKSENIFESKINKIIIAQINKKFNVNIKDIKNEKSFLINNYLGNDGYNELKELILYYNNKFDRLFFDFNFNQKIIEQMKKYICRVKCYYGEEFRGLCSGFFCKIPFPTKEKRLPVLITSGWTVDAYDMEKHKIYQISINIKGEKNIKIINLKLNNRLIYTNKKHLITIIEIKEDDNINHYLELDDNIINDILNNKDKNHEYLNTQIYYIGYPEGNLSVSFGIVENILEKEFRHNCNFKNCSVGSPILNLSTKKIIGMDSSYESHIRHYIGIFINYFIKEFIQLNYYKKEYKEISQNEINNKNAQVVKFVKYISMEKFYLVTKFFGYQVYEKLSYLFHDYSMKYYYSLDFYGFNIIQEIIEQMKNCLCKIKIGNIQGTGFFCKIPLPKTDEKLYVMITSNNILKEDILYSNNNNIDLNIGEGNKIIKINLGNRVKYTSEKYNITIIEINKNDNIKNFLEIYGTVKYLKDEYVHIIQYPEGNLSVTYGRIIDVYEDGINKFLHTCPTKKGSSGSPIIFSRYYNNEVIGLYSEENINDLNEYYNRGIFLKYPFEEYITYYFNIKKIPNNDCLIL